MPKHGEYKLVNTCRGLVPRYWLPCKECGRYFWANKHRPLVCSICFAEIKHCDKDGYIWIHLDGDNSYYDMTQEWRRCGEGWVQEHRYVMAKYLGRCLERGERVYRLNGKRDDNRIENLTLTMPTKHKQKAFLAIKARGRK